MHKPRQLRIAGYPNVSLTLRAGEYQYTSKQYF